MSNRRKGIIQIGEVSRRDALKSIATSVTLLSGAQMQLEAAQHVHARVKEEKSQVGTYKPKLFTNHEFQTMGRLAELIIPADNVSGSARDAGAPEFIDLLCSQNQDLAVIFTGGISWLDNEIQHRHAATFVDAAEDLQKAMLDRLLAAENTEKARTAQGLSFESSQHYKDFSGYGVYTPSDLGPGVKFFNWARKLTVDAFYTSEIGIKDIDFQGNTSISQYEVPEKVIDYALQHSPFKG